MGWIFVLLWGCTQSSNQTTWLCTYDSCSTCNKKSTCLLTPVLVSRTWSIFQLLFYCFAVITELISFSLRCNLHSARFKLYMSWLINPPQHEKTKREETGPQEVSEGSEVGYWIAVRVSTSPPQTVDHAICHAEQCEDLKTHHSWTQLSLLTW